MNLLHITIGMAWTTIPVKPDTKERLETQDAKQGRDWDTYLRRELLAEDIDGDAEAEPELAVEAYEERLARIEEAVDLLPERLTRHLMEELR